MKRWCLLLMIALLPLRGWSAQLMGVEMAAAQLPHALQAAPQTVSMQGMPADCPMHAAQALHDKSQDLVEGSQVSDTPQSDDGQHNGCQSCQLCMPLLGLSTATSSGADRCPMPLPQAHGRFVSAEVAQAVKPPIF